MIIKDIIAHPFSRFGFNFLKSCILLLIKVPMSFSFRVLCNPQDRNQIDHLSLQKYNIV